MLANTPPKAQKFPVFPPALMLPIGEPGWVACSSQELLELFVPAMPTQHHSSCPRSKLTASSMFVYLETTLTDCPPFLTSQQCRTLAKREVAAPSSWPRELLQRRAASIITLASQLLQPLTSKAWETTKKFPFQPLKQPFLFAA